MSTWSFVLSPGGDITSAVDVQSIQKTERLFSEMRPNSNTFAFRAQFSSSLLATLLANPTITLTVTKDGSSYFVGYLSPTWSTSIVLGRKYFDLQAEDPTLQKLGKVVSSDLVCASYSVCDPSSPSTSLVHAIASAASVTLAAGAPTISSTVPYVCVLTGDKTTYAQVLSDLLFEYGYVYYFDASGALALAQSVNTGTITTSATFDIAAGSGNIRESLTIKKDAIKYDDVRVNFKKVALKTGIVLFKDTTGATGSLEASISLAATGDSEGADYYPSGADVGEVFSEWKSPDGYDIWVATSAALDATVDAGISLSRSLTNYYRRASFAYHNTTGSAKTISKLRITGNAYVVTATNIARSSGSGLKVLSYDCKYTFGTSLAQAMARRLYHYYQYSDIRYTFKSQNEVSIGAYVLISDSVWSAISQKCRVVTKSKSEATKSFIYEVEGVADYAAVTLVLEGAAAPAYRDAMDQVNAISSDLLITPQEKPALLIKWAIIDGDGATSGSYWATRSALARMGLSSGSLDYQYGKLKGALMVDPGVILSETWNQDITVDSSWPLLWSDYYMAESNSMASISRWSQLDSDMSLDMGTWVNSSSPVVDEELDGGYWTRFIGYDESDNMGDYSSTVSYSATVDCGTFDDASAFEAYDCGVWDASSSATYNLPAVTIDCGTFAGY